jgi:hypothetical protein
MLVKEWLRVDARTGLEVPMLGMLKNAGRCPLEISWDPATKNA